MFYQFWLKLAVQSQENRIWVPSVYDSPVELLLDFSLHQGDWINPVIHRTLAENQPSWTRLSHCQNEREAREKTLNTNHAKKRSPLHPT